MTKTAKNEYARLKKENEKLLKLIGAELKKRSVGDPNWGHVGDIGHTKEQMLEILTFLRNAHDEDLMREQIERELQS
ncbi:MAG: hypothetical protein PHV82_09255 [Victivallaceae bacterium]|nr:hypothetical protein [Victivallaceae bacterium]